MFEALFQVNQRAIWLATTMNNPSALYSKLTSHQRLLKAFERHLPLLDSPKYLECPRRGRRVREWRGSCLASQRESGLADRSDYV